MENIFSLSINILRHMGLWPDDKLTITFCLKTTILYGICYVVSGIAAAHVVRGMLYGVDDLNAIVEGSISMMDGSGLFYYQYCFLSNIKAIKRMVYAIRDFEEFCPKKIMENTEKNVRKYIKAFNIYAIVGNILNMVLAIMAKNHCEKTRDPFMIKRDPCGMTLRGYWPFDVNYFPLSWMVFYLDLHTCVVASIAAFAITTLLVGALLHTITQLKHCRELMMEVSECADEMEAVEMMKFCVKYHKKIIEFSEIINEAFSSQMILHVTVTSIVLSILGFQIVIINDFDQSIRVTLHMLGWASFLFITCIFAQKLVDESLLVGHIAYSTPWYNKSLEVQKIVQFMIMRSQKPLNLMVFNVGEMNLTTFLQVMKTAYSYFTLFLNLK